jgi:hypothetical protein
MRPPENRTGPFQQIDGIVDALYLVISRSLYQALNSSLVSISQLKFVPINLSSPSRNPALHLNSSALLLCTIGDIPSNTYFG